MQHCRIVALSQQTFSEASSLAFQWASDPSSCWFFFIWISYEKLLAISMAVSSSLHFTLPEFVLPWLSPLVDGWDAEPRHSSRFVDPGKTRQVTCPGFRVQLESEQPRERMSSMQKILLPPVDVGLGCSDWSNNIAPVHSLGHNAENFRRETCRVRVRSKTDEFACVGSISRVATFQMCVKFLVKSTVTCEPVIGQMKLA